MRRIELKNAEVADCGLEPEPVGCESFRSEPMLVTVPVDGSTSHDLSIDLPAGTYDEVKFDIHEVTAGVGLHVPAGVDD